MTVNHVGATFLLRLVSEGLCLREFLSRSESIHQSRASSGKLSRVSPLCTLGELVPVPAGRRVSMHSSEKRSGEPASNSESSMPTVHGALPKTFGRYELREEIGRGGMGTVYRAWHGELQLEVALKIPKLDGPRADEHRRRFSREARSAASLRHENICRIYDLDEVDGQPYIALELITGKSLSWFVGQDRPMPERKAARLIRKLALALQHAHSRGIVHRDLKPSNIMIDAQSKQPIILDFGLARLLEDSVVDPHDLEVTETGRILGTPSYMSPEQIEADPAEIGPQTDIYSLGVILYQMLTGVVPFDGPLPTVLACILKKEPESLHSHRPRLARELASICEKMMAKDAGDRFASMQEVADALAVFIRSNAPGLSVDESSPTLDSVVEPVQHPAERGIVAILSVAVGVFVAAVLLFAAAYFRSPLHQRSRPVVRTSKPARDTTDSQVQANQESDRISNEQNEEADSVVQASSPTGPPLKPPVDVSSPPSSPSLSPSVLAAIGLEVLSETAPTDVKEFSEDKLEPGGTRGIQAGRYYMNHGQGWHAWNHMVLREGLIEVTARIVSGESCVWLANLSNVKNKLGVNLQVHRNGRITLEDSMFHRDPTTSQLTKRELVNLGNNATSEFHILGAAVGKRSIQFFWNGEPISEKIELNFDIVDAEEQSTIALGAGHPGRVEFERISWWAAQLEPAR